MKKLTIVFLFLCQFASAGVPPAGNYRVDPDHSNVGFEVNHLGVSLVVGRFNRFSGLITFQPNGDSKVSVEIDPSSVDTKVAQRDSHLRSADFFDVTLFPAARFESTRVEYDGEGNPTRIQGLLTMHGRTNEITLAVTPIGVGPGPTGELRAGFVATAKLQRSAYGMNSLLAVAGDAVALNLNIEMIRQ